MFSGKHVIHSDLTKKLMDVKTFSANCVEFQKWGMQTNMVNFI